MGTKTSIEVPESPSLVQAPKAGAIGRMKKIVLTHNRLRAVLENELEYKLISPLDPFLSTIGKTVLTTEQDHALYKHKCGHGHGYLQYKAINLRTEETCAVWIASASNPEHMKLIERQIAGMTEFPHPHLTKVCDSHICDEYAMLAVKFYERESVDAYLRHHELGEREALVITAQLLTTLSDLHDFGMWHGDIRLRNLFLTISGNVHIHGLRAAMDEEQHDEDDRNEVWMHQDEVGECVMPRDIEYVAPELIFENGTGKLINIGKCDVWSTGICLYAMLSRNLEFGNSSFITLDPITNRLTSTSDLLMNDSRIDHLSTLTRTLLDAMLMPEPRRRITADQALDLCQIAISELN